MKEIKLTQGKVAMVDDEDFERINAHKWCAVDFAGKFYAGRSENGKSAYMHREVLGTVPTGIEVDHIDGDGLNCQRNNLRFVTRRQNFQNRHIKRTSKYPGVSWDKINNKWRAGMNLNGASKNLGRFSTEEDAFRAYKKAVNIIGQEVIGEWVGV
jgi:hypothetical protein